jgi:hypothetical protein
MRTQISLSGWRADVVTLGAAAAVLGACAGSTVGSGVGDRWLARAPYYAGQVVAPGAPASGHFAVRYQDGGSGRTLFDLDAGPSTPLGALLEEMNRYLDSLGATVPLTPAAAPRGTAPRVLFGCGEDSSGTCARGTVHSDRSPGLRLAVARPSGAWIEWASAVLAEAGVERAVVLALELSEYWPRQTNWRGDKEVELGTGYTLAVPWLTALDAPVSVLQLTGALVGRDGRAIRIGAEGLAARRTNLLLSSIGVQALITDDDVAQLRSLRRDDLPGQPLVWQAALRTLVAELTGSRSSAYE